MKSEDRWKDMASQVRDLGPGSRYSEESPVGDLDEWTVSDTLLTSSAAVDDSSLGRVDGERLRKGVEATCWKSRPCGGLLGVGGSLARN
jgi:hypothetical protein